MLFRVMVRVWVTLISIRLMREKKRCIDVEYSLQLHIIETETVCKTVSRLTTAASDATVVVVTADAVDASRCHDSHYNATETNDYDSNKETMAESMSTYSDKYQ